MGTGTGTNLTVSPFSSITADRESVNNNSQRLLAGVIVKVRKANLFQTYLEVLEALADTGRLALQ